MSKKIFLLFLLDCCLYTLVRAQDNFWQEKRAIISRYQSINVADSAFKLELIENPKNVTVKITGTDSLSITHFFGINRAVHPESLCDSLVIRLLCVACSEQHLQKLIANKERKWQKLNDSSYISKKIVSKQHSLDTSSVILGVPMMNITHQSGNTLIIIYRKRYTKKQRKEILRH